MFVKNAWQILTDCPNSSHCHPVCQSITGFNDRTTIETKGQHPSGGWPFDDNDF